MERKGIRGRILTVFVRKNLAYAKTLLTQKRYPYLPLAYVRYFPTLLRKTQLLAYESKYLAFLSVLRTQRFTRQCFSTWDFYSTSEACVPMTTIAEPQLIL